MDFGTLLHMAKKNSENSKDNGKYYSTKFSPPKKESKEKKLSDNIQKFLQRREQEERNRQKEHKEKVAKLLAMRDEKSKNKIRKMLKVTKSANKSVLEDAIDSEHTAITRQGPDQPDQDDYGYVSTEANAFYQRYIEKVKDVKEEKGFAPSRPQSLKDLSGTKERVKAAITREIEEKSNPSRQRREIVNSSSSSNLNGANTAIGSRPCPSSYSSRKSLYDPEAEKLEGERKRKEEEKKKMKNRKPPPPPMDFQALLKLAEKKQFEPIEISTEVKKKEPERLLTSKEKRELEERRKAKEDRERKAKQRGDDANVEKTNKEQNSNATTTGRIETNGRIPKLANQANNKSGVVPNTKTANDDIRKLANNKTINSTNTTTKPNGSRTTSSTPRTNAKLSANSNLSNNNNKTLQTPNKSTGDGFSKNPYNNGSKQSSNSTTRDFPPRDLKICSQSDLKKSKPFIPEDIRKKSVDNRNNNKKPTTIPSKRRILNDEDDSEYDSEMDDFIDDGDAEEDYSTHIKAIFGYDKSRYRDLDEDDTAMESSFAQVQREEYISKKIGMQEDLEDMKLEAMEKKRKIMMKKRRVNN
uniref:Protein SPT2 homolog n=1 Tax=Glossina brevipalpis TaxID=37001 RepID=A0A1A9WVB6_9MUSC